MEKISSEFLKDYYNKLLGVPYGGRVVEVGVSPMVGKGSIPLLGKISRHTYPVPYDTAGGLVW